MAGYQPRGQMNGSNSSFGSSSNNSQSNRFTGSSTTSGFSNNDPPTLFPPPLPQTYSPAPTDNMPTDNMPQPTQNIMNRKAGAHSSLYQICVNLKRRLTSVPGFHEHIAEMNEEEAEDNTYIDPVTAMWNCLRRGFPLLTLYNAFRPRRSLQVDAARYGESKIGKAATFQFLRACLDELKFPSSEVFLITDLYGEDTTGFVKVTKCVNKVLDALQSRGILVERVHSATEIDESIPQTMTHRQKIVEELVKTERDYVNHLETLQQFKNEVETSGSIAGDAAHDIFLNLNALLDFQRRFLIRIEQQNYLPENEQDWGKLIYYYKESFRVYEPFIANQNRCQEVVVNQWDKLKRAPLSPDLQDLVDTPATLSGFLLKPFQRLSKYPMLLKQLHDKGGFDEARRKNLVDGEEAAKAILERANEAIHREERIRAVDDLQTRVDDWKDHRIDHFGELVLHGNYTVVKGEGTKEVEREVSEIFDSMDPHTRAMVHDVVDKTRHEAVASSPIEGECGRYRKTNETPTSSQPGTRSASRTGWNSESPTPKRRTPKVSSAQSNFSMRLPNLLGFWSPSSSKGSVTPRTSPLSSHNSVESPLSYYHHSKFNGVLKSSTTFLQSTQTLERKYADEMAVLTPYAEQYKVYLFEKILLCCKDINVNKQKNKMLGNSKSLVDKKGQPKLQLKGRIFMQNVTDVATVSKIDRSFWSVQIYWKGDPGIENFIIRFADERTMKEWEEKVLKQKRELTRADRKSGQRPRADLVFKWQQDQPQPENPYRETEEIEDDQSSQATLVPSKFTHGKSRNASNSSLQATGTQPNKNRAPHPPYGPNSTSHPYQTPSLSLNTNVPAHVPSPGEYPAQSHFSPGGADTPVSTRSSSQASMYGFSRQHIPPQNWPYENGKHRTAPAMPRAPSREGPPPSHHPSLPPTGMNPQQASRLRSASTPDPNGPGGRRMPNGQAESVPVPPIPHSMRTPINRSNTASPMELPMRAAMHSPPPQHAAYDGQGQRLNRRPEHEYAHQSTKATQFTQAASSPAVPLDDESLVPTQLKVKVLFDPHPSHVTIVVPTSIKYRTLIDRIDSKMARVSSASISRGSARLRYRDEDGDYIAIKDDEGVEDAINEWVSMHKQSLRQGGQIDDFELFWQERQEKV